MNLKTWIAGLFCWGWRAEAKAHREEAEYRHLLAEATLRAREMELDGIKASMERLSDPPPE